MEGGIAEGRARYGRFRCMAEWELAAETEIIPVQVGQACSWVQLCRD